MIRMTSPPDTWQRWQPWVPDAVAGLAVLIIGLWEVDRDLSVVSRGGISKCLTPRS